MFELVVMVCLVANQNKCEEFRVRGTEADNISACMKSASVKAEEWRTKNDDYFIIGVRCAKDSKSSFAPGDKS